jgi:Cap4 SAVED domain
LALLDIKKFIRPKSVTQFLAISELDHDAEKLIEKHRAVCITHLTLCEQTEKFANSLVRAIKPFVYSPEKLKELAESLLLEEKLPSEEIDQFITQHCSGLFRDSSVDGQLGELILYVILEQFFESIPIIRKMPITTNTELERNGADAIHLKIRNGTYELIIGEAKTYSKLTNQDSNPSNQPSYRGFAESISSAIDSFKNLWNETEIYLNNNFVPDDLKNVVKAIKRKELNHSVLICCICVYEHDSPEGNEDRENVEIMHREAEEAIKKFCKSIHYTRIPENLKPKFCLISFPVSDMNKLKEQFKCQR